MLGAPPTASGEGPQIQGLRNRIEAMDSVLWSYKVLKNKVPVCVMDRHLADTKKGSWSHSCNKHGAGKARTRDEARFAGCL